MRFLIASFIVLSSTHAFAQDLSKWKFYKAIQFNTTETGAAIQADVKNFPIAVALSKSNFNFSEAKKDGADIRFSSEKNSGVLSYHIETWDAANQSALIWVKVNAVKGNNANQSIYLHWGNATATDAGKPQDVFNINDGFVAVWHLNETGDTLVGSYKDVTSNEAHGTGVNLTAASAVNTHLGKGQNFNYPQNQWIKVDGEKRKLFDITNHLTFSIWAYAKAYSNKGDSVNRALPGYETMFAKGDNSWRVQKFGIRKWHKPEAELMEICVEKRPPHGDLCVVGKVDMAIGKWYHFTGVHDHPKVKLYVNGILDAESTFDSTWISGDHAVGIGNQSQFPSKGRQWDGMLDEARVMNVSKDEHWIKLEYENQREGQRFLTFGKTQKRF